MSSPPASPSSKKRAEAKAAAAAAAAGKPAPSAAGAAGARKDAAGGKPGAVPAKDLKPKTKKELEAERAAQEEAEKNKPPSTGSGQFEFPNGAVYEGEWQEFPTGKQRHGFGRFRHGGESYEGTWVNGHMSGRGRYTFASGAKYDGEWVADRFQGRGTYVWPAPSNGSGSSSSAMYVGDWQDNKMHGVGAFIASTGDRYQGVFHNDRFRNSEGHWIAPLAAEQAAARQQ